MSGVGKTKRGGRLTSTDTDKSREISRCDCGWNGECDCYVICQPMTLGEMGKLEILSAASDDDMI